MSKDAVPTGGSTPLCICRQGGASHRGRPRRQHMLAVNITALVHSSERRVNAQKEPGTVRRTANNGTLMATGTLAWAASGGLDALALESPLLVVTMSGGDGAEHETHGFA
ncbi:hypothetical protein B0H13DRAFT_1888656 [Mycena leptocephala]|nr:hypothetical protein B0H13DRAFT_1888656 [Mycena leptocephala]